MSLCVLLERDNYQCKNASSYTSSTWSNNRAFQRDACGMRLGSLITNVIQIPCDQLQCATTEYNPQFLKEKKQYICKRRVGGRKPWLLLIIILCLSVKIGSRKGVGKYLLSILFSYYIYPKPHCKQQKWINPKTRMIR